jgi:peptidoglycan/LPS O-acetylase OafA/YrhL
VPAWSISAEFGAYLLFPVLLLLTRVRTAGAVRLLLTVPLAWLLLALLFTPFDFRLGNGIQQVGTLRCVLQFATGMVACEIFLRYSALLTRLVPWLIAFTFTALGATIHYDIPTVVLVPPAWFALVLALAASRGWFGKLTGWSPLVYLGEISYATYMCHYLVYDVFKLLFVKKEGEATLAGLIGAAVAILLLSPVLYHLVERPCQRWMARKLAA